MDERGEDKKKRVGRKKKWISIVIERNFDGHRWMALGEFIKWNLSGDCDNGIYTIHKIHREWIHVREIEMKTQTFKLEI